MKKREIDATLNRIAQGDNEAFERLYLETRRGVYAFLFSYFRQVEDCEDAMQTVYLKIKTNIGQYKIGTNGLAWILQIAKNTALNELRRKENFQDLETADRCGERKDPWERSELRNSMMVSMKKALSEEEQRIVVLHVLWGYKHKEIAEILRCPTGTVTSKYKRAADKLKKAWKEELQ